MNFNRTKRACYYTYLSMSSIFVLPPLLFTTFRQTYGISYSLLGTLVLVNFCTQLTIDLIFSFFSKHFPIHKALKVMPLLTSLGLGIYAIVPSCFPRFAYAGLLIGTVIFSVAAGLCEVLLSPTIAAIPSEHPDRDMSFLHSLYAYGVVGVVLISTLFFQLFGMENWMYLTLFFAALPLIASYLFCTSPLPQMQLSQPDGTKKKQGVGMLLCVGCIFLGSAAENTMSNWIPSYMENVLHIPKAIGDILGLCLFAVLLGIVRTWYAKCGKKIYPILLGGMVSALICYLVAGFSSAPALGLIACVLTGLFTSMLWPGMLIFMEENIPNPGVTAYALMAAGGDLGASVAPQLLGTVTDTVSASSWARSLAPTLGLTAEQFGMKVGVTTAALFPLVGVFLLLYMRRHFRLQNK